MTHRTMVVGSLTVQINDSPADLARDAARTAHEALTQAIRERGTASAILATGNSQIAFLGELTALDGLDWSRVTLFHMDEYLGLPNHHPASFRRYMQERIVERVRPAAFHFLVGDADQPIAECLRYQNALQRQSIDLCCLGIGENGHLAFNDPPVASFDEEALVKIVKLDEACRMQQVGEGHFPSIEDTPQYALTLTIPALRRARRMLAIVPEQRKATAVAAALQGPVSTNCPASILRQQSRCTLYLDRHSASSLELSEIGG